ncbi:MAG: hypothetical protein R3C17_09870 [Planctomycetaceae bacterium]
MSSPMNVNTGGRGYSLAIAPRKLMAQQELRPPGIGPLDEFPKSATALFGSRISVSLRLPHVRR